MGKLAVFGAGGRAGRAVTTEALRRGHHVTAVVRDPGKYPGLAGSGTVVVAGDVTDRVSVEAAVRGTTAVVHAVSPFSGPEQGFADLDPRFFVDSIDALVTGMTNAGVERLLMVGLFANLRTADGGVVMDDPALFPPEIRPFAHAHTAGLDRLREVALDWLMLTPPARLSADAPRTGRYLLRDESLPFVDTELSYADLAVALLDEAEAPEHHRARAAIIAGSPGRS